MSAPEFDLNLLRGLSLILLIIAFLALWVWAWSDKRKATFRKMSELPLEEDQGIVPGTGDAGADEDDGAKETKE